MDEINKNSYEDARKIPEVAQKEKELTDKEKAFKFNFYDAMPNFTDKRLLAQNFLKTQPTYYDEAHIWWFWNGELKCWQMCDEIDVLNMIYKSTNANTINARERTEILEALKQESRKVKPISIKNSWVQFKNHIVDVITGDKIEPIPMIFATNPIPHEIGATEDTPNMDRVFEEWVGKEYVQTLYEILSYCLLSDYPIHRIFCFIGEGLNGKSKFLDLLRKFVGHTNCCSTELDHLISSRFEVARLHKKLACQMGETNFGEISKTSMLKKLSGDDLIGFEYKNKTPFEEKNYAKILISTNNLPATTDKTTGFYRRWMIIDFPNKFTEAKDILKDIPEIEYNNLALKSCRILKELLEKRTFTKEGTIEERKEKYEAKSNFLQQFVNEYTEQNEFDGFITKADFYRRFCAWSKENRHREMSETSVGMAMKKIGINEDRKSIDFRNDRGERVLARVWTGICWKEKDV